MAGSVVVLSLGVVGIGPAHAAHVTCGSTIMVSTVLDSNVGPCANGITIGADNVTLDLGGFTISGTPTFDDNVGIELRGRSRVTVKNGTVTQFGAGVLIFSGSANTVLDMKVVDNRGSSLLGDGIVVFDSDRNQVRGNQIARNGPYDGIGVFFSDFNVVDGNQIADNNVPPGTIGIDLASDTSDNIITNNVVANSSASGITLRGSQSGSTSRNQIKFNQVTGNGLDGIRLLANTIDNVVEGNNVRANRRDGIALGSAAGALPAPAGNQMLRNSSFGNAVLDLRDVQADCGTNQWRGNRAGTFAPPCTMNP